MRIKLTVLVVVLLAGLATAAPRKTITFNGSDFVHAWSGNKGAVKTEEYVESGQTLKNWQHLVAYRAYPGHKEVAPVVNAYLKQITPTEKPAIYKHNESDIMLVFLMKAPDKSYIEFNIHRFVAEGGLVRSYQFVARNWKRDVSSLASEIKANKTKWMESIGDLKTADFAEK